MTISDIILWYTVGITLIYIGMIFHVWWSKGYLGGDEIGILVSAMVPVVNILHGFALIYAIGITYFSSNKIYFKRK